MTWRVVIDSTILALLSGILAATLFGCTLDEEDLPNTPPPAPVATATVPTLAPAGATKGAGPGLPRSSPTADSQPVSRSTAATPTAPSGATAVEGLATATPKPAVSLTAGPRAMTVYAVNNPQPVDLDVQHVITDPTGFRHSFYSRVPAGASVEYHLRDIVEVPSPFTGTLQLYADKPFTAEIVGYDYP